MANGAPAGYLTAHDSRARPIRMTPARADHLVLIAAAIWGVAYVFQKTAMSDIGPFTYVAGRAIIAFLCLLPFAIRAGWAPGMGPITLLGGLVFFTAAGLQQNGW